MRRRISKSMSRKDAMRTAREYSSFILDNIIKIIVFSDERPADVQRWIKATAIWLQIIGSLTIKPFSRKFRKRELMNTLFCFMGTEVEDYELSLYSFEARNLTGKFHSEGEVVYPEFEINRELAQYLMIKCYCLMKESMPLLTDRKRHSIIEYIELVESIFSIYCS